MPRTLAALACCALLALAACSSSASTVAPSASSVAAATESPTASPTAAPSASPTASPTAEPTASPTAEPTASPTAEPSAEPTASPTAGHASTPCKATTAAGAVQVKIVDFGFRPAAIRAKVGQVIRFTNTGYEPHTATLNAGGCKTPTLERGMSDGLVFTVAGSYRFHCSIHTQMTGTITIGR